MCTGYQWCWKHQTSVLKVFCYAKKIKKRLASPLLSVDSICVFVCCALSTNYKLSFLRILNSNRLSTSGNVLLGILNQTASISWQSENRKRVTAREVLPNSHSGMSGIRTSPKMSNSTNFLVFGSIWMMLNTTWPAWCPPHNRKFKKTQTVSRNNFLIAANHGAYWLVTYNYYFIISLSNRISKNEGQSSRCSKNNLSSRYKYSCLAVVSGNRDADTKAEIKTSEFYMRWDPYVGINNRA